MVKEIGLKEKLSERETPTEMDRFMRELRV